MLVALCSSEAALLSHHECALSQIGTHLNVTLGGVEARNANKQTTNLGITLVLVWISVFVEVLHPGTI